MADKEVVDYIKNTASMGFSHASIRHALIKAGHKEDEVSTAFSHAFPSSYPSTPPNITLSPPHISSHRVPSSHSHEHHLEKSKIFLALVIFASVFSVAMLFQLYGKTTGMIGDSFSTIAANVVADTSRQKIASMDSESTIIQTPPLSTSLSPNSCLQMSEDEKDWCYFKLAKSEKNLAYCGAVNQDYLKEFCNGLFTQKPDCSKITDSALLKECEKNS